jgi:hypothetical protein
MGSFLAVFTVLCIPVLLRVGLRWQAATILFLLISLLASHGCGTTSGNPGASTGGGGGGSQSPGTPTGVTYTVTVTASVPPLSHSSSFTFVVQ